MELIALLNEVLVEVGREGGGRGKEEGKGGSVLNIDSHFVELRLSSYLQLSMHSTVFCLHLWPPTCRKTGQQQEHRWITNRSRSNSRRSSRSSRNSSMSVGRKEGRQAHQNQRKEEKGR